MFENNTTPLCFFIKLKQDNKSVGLYIMVLSGSIFSVREKVVLRVGFVGFSVKAILLLVLIGSLIVTQNLGL